MSPASIDTSNLKERIRRSKELLSDDYVNEVIKMGEHYKPVIEARTPVRSGLTRKSWTIRVKKMKDFIGWVISPDGREQIVRFLEWGTKPHIIVPRKPGGVLAFYWEKVQQFVFLRHVHHPGTKPLGLVRMTQQEVDAEGAALNEKFLAKLRQIWS